MIEKREILAVAQQTSLTPHIVEKDYVLGWMLAGIYGHEDLAESWVFKGGTCLKKCFFETYRFSEDLDFTLIKPEHLDANFLKTVFSEIGEWIYEQTGIEIPADKQEFEIYQNPRGQVSCQGKISYKGPVSSTHGLPRIKLDLTLTSVSCYRPFAHRFFTRTPTLQKTASTSWPTTTSRRSPKNSGPSPSERVLVTFTTW